MPIQTRLPYREVAVGYGPEDLVLDTVTSPARLLIACDTRRKNEPKHGGIWAYDLATNEARELPRINEPIGFQLHPHGLDAVHADTNELDILVVSHCDSPSQQSIVRYRVAENHLQFLEKIDHPLFVSPNAVAAFPDGSFLVSNDAGKRGSIWEMLFKQKKSKLIYWTKDSCSVAASKICFGNGVAIAGNKVYQASTLGNFVCSYDFVAGKCVNQKILAKVKGPDNIRIEGSDLIVACHLQFGNFIKHVKDSANHSPSVVYRIKTNGSKPPEVIYCNDGSQIDACATGLVYRKKMFLSQVFDPAILVVDLP